ncbi:alpha/beta fold hydrolase [Winogradskya humida]|uniref:AB hydrolase-1 domain-containing protein n=1 Tax=Winogradskya humida TaxID=113566 RepID=A0ABQ3ZFW7_9ACTN|nr:alpha/beta hydrolase [Actinoplanes humidus]GIE17462.1 hypothetical protein Ahu01nite_005640 [Actinoplanes humidus]
MDVSVLGNGPAVLLPVSIATMEGKAADDLRAWGADPNLGHNLATGLVDAGFQVIAADYEGHLRDEPQPRTLDAAQVAADLLAIADVAGVERFAYYGYSWLGLAGLQLALRTDRLTALAMGGFPPLGGPYAAMLDVTRTAYQMSLEEKQSPAQAAEPGDWDSADFTLTPDQTQQYVTLYESLQGFDERAALDKVDIPRLVLIGENDTIQYGEKWDNARVSMADAIHEFGAELTERAWGVHIIPEADHMGAMQAAAVLPILVPFLEKLRP